MASAQTRRWEPPTDEQLRSFIKVRVAARARDLGMDADPEFAAELAMANPRLKDAWLEQHRELQEAAWALAGQGQEGADRG